MDSYSFPRPFAKCNITVKMFRNEGNPLKRGHVARSPRQVARCPRRPKTRGIHEIDLIQEVLTFLQSFGKLSVTLLCARKNKESLNDS